MKEPSGSRRSSRWRRPATTRSPPSGSQSMQNGNPKSPAATTSAPPFSSTVTICCAPQSQTQSRPSCQRGDSPIESPVRSVRICGFIITTTIGTHHIGQLLLKFLLPVRQSPDSFPAPAMSKLKARRMVPARLPSIAWCEIIEVSESHTAIGSRGTPLWGKSQILVSATKSIPSTRGTLVTGLKLACLACR
jgi:hypothetical protein